MQRSRVGDDHRVGLVLFQRFVDIGFDGIARQFVIGQGGAVTSQENNILFAEGDQVAKVSASDGAEASDEEFCRLGFGELGMVGW